MITQIYGITNVQDAAASVEAGADYIGLVLSGPLAAENVSLKTARDIFAQIDGQVKKKVAILDLGDCTEDGVLTLAEELGLDILHLSGAIKTSQAFWEKFKARLPGMELMQAIPMTGPSALDFAEQTAPFCDYFILDSVRADTHIIGAAGIPHDWNISRRIVDRFKDVKVILAGGLGPDNVAEAIEFVRPFGVDSLTKTNLVTDGASLRKDIEKVRRFCEIAHSYS